MPLVTSLLTAIVRADGDALVLHAGERPYVVAPTGQKELASRALTLDAVKGMLNELLPAEARQSLDEIGAVQHDLGSPGFAQGQSFSVVAARGGDDIWIEIRRHRKLGATGALGATGLSTGAICEEGAAVEAVCVGSAEVDAFCVPAVSESFAAIVADVALSASMTIRYGL